MHRRRFRHVQTPGLIVMMYEPDYTRRQIYTDGRKLPDDPNPTFIELKANTCQPPMRTR
jgi:hypothetical protein